MNWQDKGYLISSNRYNENSSIIELFTQERGKVKGILFGATSKKIKNYLFVGNCFHINFSSKNENSIGNFKLEIDKVNTPIFLEDQIKLSCIVNIFNLIKLLTVENQKNGKIFELISIFFELLIKENWLTLYIFWELDLYKNLGYELNFSNYTKKIKLNGTHKYFSLSDEKKVPNFLVENSIENISKEDLIAGIDIIGNFLEKSILNQNNLSVPETRISFVNLVRKL